MPSRRAYQSSKKVNGNQLVFIKSLIEELGRERSMVIGLAALEDPRTGKGINIFDPVAGRYDWQRETRLDHLNSYQASILIDALLDAAGRGGRRKNNRRNQRAS